MRIVSISPYFPHPEAMHAGGRVYFEHISRLARTNEVTVICPGESSQTTLPLPFNIVRLSLAPSRRLTQLRDAITGNTAGSPFVDALSSNPDVRSALVSVDIVELQWSELLSLVGMVKNQSPSVRLVVFIHDRRIDALASVRKSQLPLRRRAIAALRSLRAAAAEDKGLRACDGAIFLSAPEAATARIYEPGTRILSIDPYLEIPRLSKKGKDVLFVGALNREENAQGVTWLLEKVWPLVIQELPEAQLLIAGANAPKSLSDAVTAATNASNYGRFDDLDTVYDRCAVAVAPLFIAGGVKIKVLDALLRLKPVVCTPVAAAGIVERVGLQSFFAVTQDPTDFATGVVQALTDSDKTEEIAHELRRIRDEFHFADETAKAVDAFFEALVHKRLRHE